MISRAFNQIKFLLVTCCLEKTRTDVLKQVIDNIKQEAPFLLDEAVVFDNGSTDTEVQPLIKQFKHTFVSDRNVGYWSAVDWWLTHIKPEQPKYTYIIESDMIHYDFNKLLLASRFLDQNDDIGAVRLHEYSVTNKHLYNKDIPNEKSRRTVWQSHTNKVTGKPILVDNIGWCGVHTANFLTQLPALNRYKTMCRVFDELRNMKEFSELDFQRLYHNEYELNAILDGGIYNSDPGSIFSNTITGSWTTQSDLTKVGYHPTRHATILNNLKYTVTRLG